MLLGKEIVDLGEPYKILDNESIIEEAVYTVVSYDYGFTWYKRVD